MVEPRSDKRLLHLALAVIGVAYLLLGLAVAYFAVNLGRSPDIGAAYSAVGILALGGTISAAGLLVGSVLGTLVFVRTASTRRVLYVLAILSGWIGTLVLGWLAWQFWTHSFPRRAQLRDASVLTNEPRIVDIHFASRHRLCPEGAASGGIGRANDHQRSIAEFLGPALREIAIHQVGDSLATFTRVRAQVEEVFAHRPRVFSRYTPWAEATPLGTNGILGTLRYSGKRSGQLEISGSHLCFQDSTGVLWWARVAPVDVWP